MLITNLSRVALLAAALTGASSSYAAATYQLRVPLQGLNVAGSSNPVVSLGALALPDGTVGLPYSADLRTALTVTGFPDYNALGATWSVTAGGALPAGLSLSPDGVISGTPNSASATALPVPITVTYDSVTGSQTYALTINLNIEVSLNTTTLPSAMVSVAYSYDFKPLLAVTGDPDYSASLATFSTSSTLPAGLALTPAGLLTGTPTAAIPTGSSFQVLATYKTKTGQQAFTIVVNGATLQVTQIVSGESHTCAVTTAGEAKCWGANASNQLGVPGLAESSHPVTVTGLLSGVTEIAVGASHSCAVVSGSAKCWGYNGAGALGTGNTTDSAVPVTVQGLDSGISSITAGNYHSCAITTSGAAKCWGWSGDGRLGYATGGEGARVKPPVDVVGLGAGVSQISAGGRHTCAIVSGAAKCWGYGYDGELGQNSMSSSETPVTPLGLSAGMAAISAGQEHTCAITAAGGAKCWGANTDGRLGWTGAYSSLTPVNVTGLSSGVTQIAAGYYTTCAVIAGSAKCWGYNGYGQYGNGTSGSGWAPTPTDVSGLGSGVTSISLGSRHICGTAGTSAKCWGLASSGRLGNGVTSSTVQITPVDVQP
jgi:alpha-tubulin suppressor-like RCC1 family protein